MAADDTKGKKRKGAQDAAPKAKKARKSDDVAPAATPAESKPTRKSARKQAADFMDVVEEAAPVSAPEPAKAKKGKKSKSSAGVEPEATEPVAEVAEVTEVQEKPKKGKKVKAVVVEETTVVEAPKQKAKKSKKAAEEVTAIPVEEQPVSAKSAKAKGGKKQKVPEPEPEPAAEITAEVDDAEDNTAEDDQTAALLAGFESEDDDDSDADEDVNFNEDEKAPKLSAKQRKAIKQAEDAPKSNVPGVIYVGRVPRGFFEPQMKKYFSQFGKVNKLRLSRNKKTGASKHYAFVEFQSQEVADIVARTMNNYLLFGHILKVHLIPTEQVHPDLFKGATERFKVDPRNKKAGLEMERGVERSQWEKRVANEDKRRAEKAKELKEIFGYEYVAPTLKTVDSVPKQLLAGESTEEAPMVEQPKAKNGKKVAKGKVVNEVKDTIDEAPEPIEPVTEKVNGKGKKRKSDVAVEATVTEETVSEVGPKAKKSKKETKVLEPATEDVAEKKRKAKPEQEAVAKPKKGKKVKA